MVNYELFYSLVRFQYFNSKAFLSPFVSIFFLCNTENAFSCKTHIKPLSKMLINRFFHSFIYRVSVAFWAFEIQSLNVGQRHLNESIFGNAKRNYSCFDRSSVCSVEWFTQPNRTNRTQIVYFIVDPRVYGCINEN